MFISNQIRSQWMQCQLLLCHIDFTFVYHIMYMTIINDTMTLLAGYPDRITIFNMILDMKL